MSALLPCPFCGGEAVIEEIENSIYGGVRFSVGCSSEQEVSCMGYQSLTSFARRGEAAEAWNRRAVPSPTVFVTADYTNLRQGTTALEPTPVFTVGAHLGVQK